MKLYHATTRTIRNQFRIKGICGFGVYFAKTKRDAKTFGDLVYMVELKPKNTLTIHDNEIKKYNFFNITQQSFDEYRSNGFDSICWMKNGKIKEFIALDVDVIISKELI
jgi:hypothetical protein